MKRLMISFVARLLFALGLTVGGHTAATPLLTLASMGTPVSVGGLRFDSWYFNLGQGNASNIDVTALSDGGLDPGPGLQFNFGDGFTVSVDGSATLTIGYRVRAEDAGLLIKDNSIELSDYGLLSFTNTTLVRVLARESVGTSQGAADVSSKDVFAEYTDQGGFNTGLERSTNFLTPFHDLLWAESVITLTADGSGAYARIEELKERFSLQRVPEPATLSLFGLGLAGIGVVRRRKRPA